MPRKVRFIEIRDRSTFIPAVALEVSLKGNSFDDYLPRRCGYGDRTCILLTRLEGGGKACNDPYDWNDRTFKVAHDYIEKNWDEVIDGDVIDVEFILGETTKAKVSERYETAA